MIELNVMVYNAEHLAFVAKALVEAEKAFAATIPVEVPQRVDFVETTDETNETVVEAVTGEWVPVADFVKPHDSRAHGSLDEALGCEVCQVTARGVVAATQVAPPAIDLEARVRQFASRNGAPAVVAVLSEFGVRRVSELPADKVAAFVERLG